ncbi:hypothetical protein [Xanthobacter sp. YC-JY1]|uniref:hypothetical protein n=1 Tax=Xanthobacter sp. YC-JY1 TaxID=2419844 RepID=UPI001F3E0379|nr:hypothetical protein [Xanthobacter sp. YC-JY1]
MATVADVLRAHDIPEPETAARDLTALTRGMIDAAGMFGETEIASLERASSAPSTAICGWTEARAMRAGATVKTSTGGRRGASKWTIR